METYINEQFSKSERIMTEVAEPTRKMSHHNGPNQEKSQNEYMLDIKFDQEANQYKIYKKCGISIDNLDIEEPSNNINGESIKKSKFDLKANFADKNQLPIPTESEIPGSRNGDCDKKLDTLVIPKYTITDVNVVCPVCKNKALAIVTIEGGRLAYILCCFSKKFLKTIHHCNRCQANLNGLTRSSNNFH